jgi:hypothetical protein
MHMKKLRMIFSMITGALIFTAPAIPMAVADQGQGQASITILPKDDERSPANLRLQDLQLKIEGKETSITSWLPLHGSDIDTELVVLIDSSARPSLGGQLDEIADFIQKLPAETKVAVAYMNSGRAVLSGLLSTNHADVANQLHLPGGMAGSNSSPYFCLSDLAKKWPSQNHAARRVAVLITNGVDNYYGHYDPQDPYVEAAINDSIRAGLVVYSIYWSDQGRSSESRSASYDGQRLLTQVSQATGGSIYFDGSGNPVSLIPYFDGINKRLQSQYRITFQIRLKGKPEVRNLSLKTSVPSINLYAPQRVLIKPSSGD